MAPQGVFYAHAGNEEKNAGYALTARGGFSSILTPIPRLNYYSLFASTYEPLLPPSLFFTSICSGPAS